MPKKHKTISEDTLKNGIEDEFNNLFIKEKYIAFLDKIAIFMNYSTSNIMRIHFQSEYATDIRTEEEWAKLSRRAIISQKNSIIAIYAPAVLMGEDDKPLEELIDNETDMPYITTDGDAQLRKETNDTTKSVLTKCYDISIVEPKEDLTPPPIMKQITAQSVKWESSHYDAINHILTYTTKYIHSTLEVEYRALDSEYTHQVIYEPEKAMLLIQEDLQEEELTKALLLGYIEIMVYSNTTPEVALSDIAKKASEKANLLQYKSICGVIFKRYGIEYKDVYTYDEISALSEMSLDAIMELMDSIRQKAWRLSAKIDAKFKDVCMDNNICYEEEWGTEEHKEMQQPPIETKDVEVSMLGETFIEKEIVIPEKVTPDMPSETTTENGEQESTSPATAEPKQTPSETTAETPEDKNIVASATIIIQEEIKVLEDNIVQEQIFLKNKDGMFIIYKLIETPVNEKYINLSRAELLKMGEDVMRSRYRVVYRSAMINDETPTKIIFRLLNEIQNANTKTKAVLQIDGKPLVLHKSDVISLKRNGTVRSYLLSEFSELSPKDSLLHEKHKPLNAFIGAADMVYETITAVTTAETQEVPLTHEEAAKRNEEAEMQMVYECLKAVDTAIRGCKTSQGKYNINNAVKYTIRHCERNALIKAVAFVTQIKQYGKQTEREWAVKQLENVEYKVDITPYKVYEHQTLIEYFITIFIAEAEKPTFRDLVTSAQEAKRARKAESES